MSDETFTLEVRRRMSSAVDAFDRYEIAGSGAFIVQEVDVLLADPLLLGFTLNRYSPRLSADSQVDSGEPNRAENTHQTRSSL